MQPVNHSLPQDYQARQAALDPTRSFAVSAPAGSGKTGLLTQRLLKLLSLCENPEEILAITFTRKAAGEMQDRVLQALWNAREQPKPSNPHDLLTWELAQAVLKHNDAQGWNLLQCPQRLRIQTIDSLCSRISQQLPLANGFGSQLQPSDNADALYRQAVHQLLNELETETSVQVDLSLLLDHLDNNIQSLEHLLMQLLAKRDQWLGVIFQAKKINARYYLENILIDIIQENLHSVYDLLLLHGSELSNIADWAASNLQESSPDSIVAKLHGITGLPSPELKDLNTWLALAEFLVTGTGDFRKIKGLTKNQGFPAAKDNKSSAEYKTRFEELVNAIAESHAAAANTIHELRYLPPCAYDENQWALIDALTRLLPRLAAILDVVFATHGETDFTAVSQAALKALGDEDSPSDIALQMDYRIRHILVDEFQDTSSTQLQLLQRLTSGWQIDDGRSLFIVGDGMQSCYSFRNANVGIFLEARAQGIGNLSLEPLDLTVNFRSQSGVVNWVNQQFLHAFPADDDISRSAVKYSPSHAFKPELEGDAVELWLSGFHKIDEQEENNNEDFITGEKYIAELQEAEAVAQLIKNLREQNPEDSVALLARSRNHLQYIFPAMSRLNLRWQATDIDSLAQRMAIIDLTSLTRALLNPTDRISWLAILRAPWCGLDLHDLHAITHAQFKDKNPAIKEAGFPNIWQQLLLYKEIENLSTTGKILLARFMDIVKPAIAERCRKSLRQWVEGAWLALGGPATLLDPQDINDIPTFFSLIEQHQRGGNIEDWGAFAKAIQKLYAAPRKNADPKLQVMTMHKSKGLEFDHVIIPRLHKLPAKDNQQLMLWRERLNHKGEPQLLLGPLAPVGGEKDKLYAYLKKESSLQLEYEATRLFYVGCTRAIKKLYLFASLMKDENGEWKAPANKSLLNSIWKNTQQQAKTITPEKFIQHNQQTYFERPGLQQLLRLKAEWHAPDLFDNQLLKSYRGKEVSTEENIPIAETQEVKRAKHTGILIHRALQNLTGKLKKVDIQAWIETQKAFWIISLKQQGFNTDEVNHALDKICCAITNTINDPDGQWLLNDAHLQSACELAITHKQGNLIDLKLRENIIDRTFIKDGVRWIIDYKSSEPQSGQTEGDFIQQELKSYKSQLVRYQACFTALGETEIKMALYFPLLKNNKRLYELSE